jgi:molybdopterin-guanine dinucleotide biosynthesis protein A
MGADKASLPFAGATLIEHVIARFAPPGTPVLVSTRSEPAFVPEGAVRIVDPEPGLGPLAGMAALLRNAPTRFVLVVPTDLPLFPPRCAEKMLALGTHDAVVLSWKGRIEPFPSLIDAALAPLLADLLRRGLRRADAFHEHASCHAVAFERLFPGCDGDVAFLNANTPEDLARAEALIAAERP